MSKKPDMQQLLAVARGQEPADLVLTGGQVVNVFTGELERTSIAISQGVIAGLGDYRGRQQTDLGGRLVSPGFIDGHLHIESTFLSPAQFARAVCPRGTSAVIADPHEIANVMGVEGVSAMLDASEGLPVTCYFMAPSCVPSSGLQDAGAILGADEMRLLARHERVLGLGEMMNYPGTVGGDPEVLAKLAALTGKPADGHAPLLSGKGLCAYLAAGPDSDHECTRLDEAREKLARGMWLMIRQGTSAHNLADLLPAVTPLTERRCMLVSDDQHPDALLENGHVDQLLRLAVSRGLGGVSALRLVTINPARRFGLRRRGAIAPGYWADLAVIDDLSGFHVSRVYKAGELAAKDGRCLAACDTGFPEHARQTMHLPELDESLLQMPVTASRARIIELVPGQILTNMAVEAVPQQGGMLAADPQRDLAKLAVIDRHHGSGRRGLGLVRGLGLQQGALASSVAHDTHNLVLAGADDRSMLTAARRVREMGGGLAVASGDKVLASLPLPLAGLMSDQPVDKVAESLGDLGMATAQLSNFAEPFMPLSFLSLEVIPHLKLTDRGLVDVDTFQRVELMVD